MLALPTLTWLLAPPGSLPALSCRRTWAACSHPSSVDEDVLSLNTPMPAGIERQLARRAGRRGVQRHPVDVLRVLHRRWRSRRVGAWGRSARCRPPTAPGARKPDQAPVDGAQFQVSGPLRSLDQTKLAIREHAQAVQIDPGAGFAEMTSLLPSAAFASSTSSVRWSRLWRCTSRALASEPSRRAPDRCRRCLPRSIS